MSNNALAAGLRHLRSQMAGQRRNEEGDEQLLDAFLSRRDEDAFAVLVRRHGPMVLHVCRRVLGQQQDAEDAFQAVFVLLARNAAGLRKKTALAGFLHGAAYRIALTAKRSAARRRKHECQAPVRSLADPADELSWREVRALLDEEIARLPEKYRSVFVLYHLENLSREETGRRLGLPDATVAKRLAEARKRLGQRLTRRGVELTSILAASTLAAQPASALPAGLMTTTMQAALATAGGASLAGIVSPSAAELVKDGAAVLSSGKFKWVMLLLAVCLLGGSGAWVGFRTEAVPSEAPPASEKAKLAVPAQSATKDEDKDAIAYAGRVLDTDEKPIAGAKVYYYFITRQDEPIPVRATTDAHGRFAFTLTAKDIPLSADARQADPRKAGHIVVKADGYTFAWQHAALIQIQKELTLHVAADDTPLRGRIIDLQGRALAGLRVSAWSAAAPEKSDLTPFVKALQAHEAFYTSLFQHVPIYLCNPLAMSCQRVRLLPATTTDADGRFRLQGFAKEQLVEVRIEGPTIETRNLFVMTRPSPRDGGKLLSVPRIKQPAMFGPSEQIGVLANGFDYPAPPGLTVNGTVQDAATKRPIPRAIVESYMLAGTNLAQNTIYHTVADDQGRYHFTGLRRGPGNHIRIRPPADQPYIPVVKDVPLPVVKGVPGVMSIAEATVDVALDRGVWVDVTVADKNTGRPVLGDFTYFVLPEKVPPNGLFTVPSQFRGAYNGFMPTRKDGTFRFVAAPRRAILAFRTYGNKYPIAREAATIRLPGGLAPSNFHAFAEINPKLGDAPVKVKFTLDSGRIVKGKLVDPEGRLLSGGTLASGLRSDSELEPEGLESADFTVLDLHRPRLLCFVDAKKRAGSAVVRGDEKGPITVKMHPWATVSGRLLDADGKPIANADLAFTEIPVRKPGQPMALDTGWHVVQHFAGQPRLDPRTDDQGRFRVERLVPGLKYNLALIELGAQTRWEGLVFSNLVLKPGESKELGDVKLQPFPERTPGEEKPPPATPQPTQPPVKSYRPRNPSAPSPDKGEKRETMSVTGQVLDPEGKPLAGARVAVLAGIQRVLRDGGLSMARRALGQGETDREGRFRLTVPRTSSLRNWVVNVVAAHAGYGLACQSFDADAAQPTVVIRLHPEQSLCGRLMDLQGQPVAGAKLQIVSIDKKEGPGITLDGLRHMGFLWPKPIDTDKNGQFAVHGVGGGATVALLTEHQRCSPQRLELAAGQTKTFVLPPARLLEGRVLYADTGKPVPHVEVVGWGVVGKSDEHGWFRLNPTSGPIYNQEESGLVLAYAPEGEPYLNVQKAFRWPKATLKHRVDLALPRGVSVRGQVTEKDSGKPVAGALVFYQAQLNNPNAKRAEAGLNNYANGRIAVTSKPDGTFQIACLPGPGYLTIEGPEPDYALAENGGCDRLFFGKHGGQPWLSHGFAAVDLQLGAKPPEIAVALRKGVTLKATVTGPAGRPVGDLQVFCPLEGFATSPIKIRGNRLELHGCDAERTLRVMVFDAKNQWGATVEMSKQNAGEKPLPITLAPCGSARIRFLNAEGKPLTNFYPGLFLELAPKHGNLRAQTTQVFSPFRKPGPHTDEQGWCTLVALIPGATYQFGHAEIETTFIAKPGEVLNLPDVVMK